MENETTTKDLSKPIWKKYHFKNGKDYELAIANNKGILVFRDSVFSAPFDEKDDLKRRTEITNKWSKCTLKPLLEKWRNKFAPDELKDNYKISIPHIYNIFPDEAFPPEFKGKNKRWEIYKNWRNRLFGHHQYLETTSVRTKTKRPNRSYEVVLADANGSLCYCNTNFHTGVVPCLIPIKKNKVKGE